MLIDHPWLGVGLGQFEFFSTRYAFPVRTHWAKYTRVAENAHSEYLQAGAELGVPGLLAVLGICALLLLAALRRLRALPRPSRGPVATFLAGSLSIAVHAAADFPLHAPPGALLLVLFAAGLRLHGADGLGRPMAFRIRPLYATAAAVVALAVAGAAIRPVVGFWYFLGGIGAPRNLLDEKESLERAPREALPTPDAVRLLTLAARIDFVNAPYHRALGSRLFQSYLRGEAGEDALQSALFHLAYAAELNPNQFQYAVNSGQAMISLARRAPPGRERLGAALGHFRRAAALAPFQYKLYTEIGVLADELGDAASAEAALRRTVALEEYYLRGWYNLGTFYARHGRLEEAREAFSHGARLAAEAASLVPTSDDERELIALDPETFYNELQKIEAIEHPGGAAS
jgi:tetratricopeptide (TPR) repeat protein